MEGEGLGIDLGWGRRRIAEMMQDRKFVGHGEGGRIVEGESRTGRRRQTWLWDGNLRERNEG